LAQIQTLLGWGRLGTSPRDGTYRQMDQPKLIGSLAGMSLHNKKKKKITPVETFEILLKFSLALVFKYHVFI
jgi:hypothetical protein